MEMFLSTDALFMALAAGVIPFLVSLTKRISGDKLWPEFNAPTIAVIWGAVLGGLYYYALPALGRSNDQIQETFLMHIIGGGFAGLAAAGLNAVAKDVRDGSISGSKGAKIPRQWLILLPLLVIPLSGCGTIADYFVKPTEQEMTRIEYDALSREYVKLGNQVESDRRARSVSDSEWTQFEMYQSEIGALSRDALQLLNEWKEQGAKPDRIDAVMRDLRSQMSGLRSLVGGE